ncbi:glycosyl transferase [Oscillatoriales cyanobacterium USR001]|nr:glycosyl transferase [Oscillatoriales cyanobacterium USR001]
MSKHILFSVIIPTYNRPDRLSTCLQSLLEMDYPRDNFEVIVVNDGSEMPLESYVIPLEKFLHISLITQPNSGPAKARNRGAFVAQGKFLVFTDDDCTPGVDWLKNLELRFSLVPDCLVGGKTINALRDNLYSAASQQLIDYLYSYYNANPEAARFFASNNFALPTAYFQSIGGFDTTFPLAAGEDREFCDRVLAQGYNMVYAPEVIVYHAHHLTLSKFWRQQFNYGRGAFQFQQIAVQRSQKQLQHPSFYLKLLTYPFSQNTGIKMLLIAGLFLVSQVGIAAGLFWEKNAHS